MEFPSPSNAHWLPWLQQKFLRAGVLAQCLEMPKPYNPDYAAWCQVWERQRLGPEDILVGHSAGGGFLVKWLSANPQVKVGQVVLVAPWMDPKRECGDFLLGELDPALPERIGALHVLIADNEGVDGVPETVARLCRDYPLAQLHRFAGMGHFCESDTGVAFEPLWDICSVRKGS